MQNEELEEKITMLEELCYKDDRCRNRNAGVFENLFTAI